MALIRHHQPKFKLSLLWRFVFAVLILIGLVAFKDVFYRWEKNEKEQSQETSGIVDYKTTPVVSQAAPSTTPKSLQAQQPTSTPPAAAQAAPYKINRTGDDSEDDD